MKEPVKRRGEAT